MRGLGSLASTGAAPFCFGAGGATGGGATGFGASAFGAGAAGSAPAASVSNTTIAEPTGGHVARLAIDLRHDRPLTGDGHLNGRLIRHHVNERRVFLHHVAHAHVPGDDFGLGRAFAHIRQLESILAHLLLRPPSRGAWL
jgi:hypothetical protein